MEKIRELNKWCEHIFDDVLDEFLPLAVFAVIVFGTAVVFLVISGVVYRVIFP